MFCGLTKYKSAKATPPNVNEVKYNIISSLKNNFTFNGLNAIYTMAIESIIFKNMLEHISSTDIYESTA